jgi:hypothetical protein
MVKKEYGRIEEKKKSSEEEEEGGMRDFPKNDRQEHVISSQSERVSIWDLYNGVGPPCAMRPSLAHIKFIHNQYSPPIYFLSTISFVITSAIPPR